MKKYIILALCLTLALPATYAKGDKKEKTKKEQKVKSTKGSKEQKDCKKECFKATLSTLQDSIAYAYGMAMGKQTLGMLKQMESDLEFNLSKDIIISSMLTQLSGDSANMLYTDEQLGAVYSNVNNLLREAAQSKQAAALEKNKKEGAEFLAKMESEPGVTKTESGLLYKVDKMGDGIKPDINSLVQVNYIGKLIDGTEFDNSYKRGKAQDFSLANLIRGWQEGICLMPVGSKFTFYIPYELGYGERGQGPIPPASVLIFEVELLEVTPNE